MIIYISDVRKYYCVSGIKFWFKTHDLDFKDFLDNGIDSQKLLDTGDELANRVVEGKLNNG